MEKGNKIILVLGILVIAAGIYIYFEADSFQKKAILTDGKVVHVLGSSYKIQYFTEDGSEKIKQGSQKNNRYREGNPVKLWYSTENPEKARLSDGKRDGKNFIIAGVVCVLLGIYPLLMKKKGNKTA